MKIIFDKNIISNALAPAMGCVSNKNTLSAIEGIMLTSIGSDKCELCAYDLEKGYRTIIEAEVIEEGQYIINAVKINQIIRVMPEGKIKISVDEKGICEVTGGKSRFELHSLPGSEFPALPDLSGETGFTVKESVLRSMISQTLFAVAQNDTRAVLNGSYFEIKDGMLKIVSCDGNRLAIREQKNIIKDSEISEFKFIIPVKPLGEMLKLLSEDDEKTAELIPSRKHIMLRMGDIVFFSRLIDSEYIEYERFIPRSSKTFVLVDTEILSMSLERALLVTEDRNMGQTKSPVRCTFGEGLLKISSASVTGRVYDEIPVEMTGENIEIAFNCRYIVDAIKSADVERVKLSLSSPLMSMIVEAAEEDENGRFLFLVLPTKA